LDLKGAAPRPEYLAELFPLFGRLNFNAILMEYEDIFPYSGELAKFARKTAYNVSTIEWINQMTESNGLELIPLVQTFGHMEFALKHVEFASLREVPIYTDTICPSSDQSISLIRKMISQVKGQKKINGII
jgi:hexosaminidase